MNETTDVRPGATRVLVAGCAALIALAGCGGGGGGDGGGSSTDFGTGFRGATAEAQHCASPRPVGTLDPDGQPYGDVQGTVADEKAWLRK
ncbi:MAG TPA: hypothetical protein VIO33_21655, partial [Burkholderiaceae bacterium]